MSAPRHSKPRPRLTWGEQALVEMAAGYIGTIIAQYERTYGRHDFREHAYLRLCEHATEFDPSRSGLRTWAMMHAHFACMDIVRQLAKRSNKHRPLSLEGTNVNKSSTGRKLFLKDVVPAPHVDLDVEIDPLEEVHARLRGIKSASYAIIVGSLIEGRTLKAIAIDLGISEGRACHIRTSAVNFLRSRTEG